MINSGGDQVRFPPLQINGQSGNETYAILLCSCTKDDCKSPFPLRFWIELGFKALKSLGFQWNKTRRTDPQRVSRHWLVLSVATLLTMAYGSRVEDAADAGRAPGNLRAPPKCLPPTHRSAHSSPSRSVSVFRLGILWLRRLLHRGRMWKRVWLLPEQWPKPPPEMKIIQHAVP